MAAGSIRERGGRYYIRTRVQVIDSKTGEVSWRQVEKAAGTSKRAAEKMLRGLRDDVERGAYMPTTTTVLELGQKWLREHVQPNLKPGAAANYKGTFYKHVAPMLGQVRVDDCKPAMVKALLGRKRRGRAERRVGREDPPAHARDVRVRPGRRPADYQSGCGAAEARPETAPEREGDGA